MRISPPPPRMFFNVHITCRYRQGALGEAFDAALKAVEDGAGAEAECDSNNGAAAAAATAPKLPGSLRHVWFDFHHEVRVLEGGFGCVLGGFYLVHVF